EAARVAIERVFTDSRVAKAAATVKRLITIGGVSSTSAEEEGVTTDRCIMISASVAEQRAITDRCVVVSGGMAGKREHSIGCVEAAAFVKDERVSSNSRVLCAGGVEQKRCSAHCGIGIRIVEGQRSAANTCVGAASAIQKERTPTKCCISRAIGDRIECVAAFRCCEIIIASVRRWTDCLYLWQKRKAGKHERNDEERGQRRAVHQLS